MGKARHHLAKLQVNSVVKAFILAEVFLWSGLNVITLFLSLYVSRLPGGSIQNAATATSMYYISRVIFGLISGRLLIKKGKEFKFFVTIGSMSLLSISYILISLTQSVTLVYLFFAMIGMGIGIATPAKNSLFSSHINKEKESLTWSVLDASIFLTLAVTSSVAGIILTKYGFRSLFYIAATMNALAIIPYILYLQQWKKYISLSKFSTQWSQLHQGNTLVKNYLPAEE